VSPAAQPVEVRRLPPGALRILWSDGHVGEYATRRLRGFCPCAVCQGHGAAALVFHEPPGEVGIDGIDVVGRYALCFRFDDGHATGIFRFDLLRALCECPLCAAGGAGPPAVLG
jgi:DUF971 family protein